MPANTITTSEVAQAKAELDKMRRSLAGWLKFRTRNDQILNGTYAGRLRVPVTHAQRVIAAHRDVGAEQDLATKLSALLQRLMPDQQLPSANLSQNPDAAVQLAQIALNGGQVSSPAAQAGIFSAGSASHPWLWPVLIVGGLLLVITTAIKTAADVAKDSEEKACIEAGACTDSGFWMKWGAITVIGWFAWKELGVGDMVRGLRKKGAK